MPGLQLPMCVVVYRLVWAAADGFLVIFHDDILFRQIRLIPGPILQCVCLQSGITLRDRGCHWHRGDMIEVGIGIRHAAEWSKCDERTAYRKIRENNRHKKLNRRRKNQIIKKGCTETEIRKQRENRSVGYSSGRSIVDYAS